MIATTHTIERATIRAELDRRRMIRSADQLRDWQAHERQIERAARQDALARQTPTSSKRDLTARTALATAERRDALRSALNYSLTPDELQAAAQRACLRAKVPADHVADIGQDVILHVLRRHGAAPTAADVNADWLRQLAGAFFLKANERHERATGARATAEQLRDWRQGDADAAKAQLAAEAHQSGDLIWSLAAARPAPEPIVTVTAERIAEQLAHAITPGQAAALLLALRTDHRTVAAMTSTDRNQWAYARKSLRNRFRTVEALRLAYRPIQYTAAMMVDRTKADAMRLAKVAKTGNGIALTRWQGSTMPHARPMPPAVALVRALERAAAVRPDARPKIV